MDCSISRSQAQFSSQNSVDIAELNTLLGMAKSLGHEMSDNLRTTNEHASSMVHDSDTLNNLVLVNETVPRVCRILSTRITYLQHQHRITSAKKATDQLRRVLRE